MVSQLLTLDDRTTQQGDYRAEDLLCVYEHIKDRVRHVSGSPHLTLYDTAWHMNLDIPDMTAEELIFIWETAGTNFTWIEGRDEDKWKLNDASRVLRKVRVAQNTLRLGAWQRTKGRGTEQQVWSKLNELGPTKLQVLANLLGMDKNRVSKALKRLAARGYAQKDIRTWSVLKTLPGYNPIQLDLHSTRIPNRKSILLHQDPLLGIPVQEYQVRCEPASHRFGRGAD